MLEIFRDLHDMLARKKEGNKRKVFLDKARTTLVCDPTTTEVNKAYRKAYLAREIDHRAREGVTTMDACNASLHCARETKLTPARLDGFPYMWYLVPPDSEPRDKNWVNRNVIAPPFFYKLPDGPAAITHVENCTSFGCTSVYSRGFTASRQW